MIAIDFDGQRITLVEDRYANGRLAIRAVCEDGSPFGMLTVNLDSPLADDEVFVKTWSENSSWAPQALEAMHLIPTGREVSSGFVSAPIYRKEPA